MRHRPTVATVRRWRLLVVAFAAAGLLVAGCSPVGDQAGVPTPDAVGTGVSTTEVVTPYPVDVAGTGDNPSCAELGIPVLSAGLTLTNGTSSAGSELSGGPIRVAGAAPVGDGSVTVEITDTTNAETVGAVRVHFDGDQALDWSATVPVEVVAVTRGDTAHVYAYPPGVSGDTGLTPPATANGDPGTIDHVRWCASEQPGGDTTAWCPPAFWADPANRWAWDDTGFDPTDRYLNFFDEATLLVPGTSPILAGVLDQPLRFGGEAVANVADLLSDAHPGVAWRLGDSRSPTRCPTR
jgi:hypothetical protein